MHPIELDAILKLAKSKLRAGQVPEAEGMYRRALKEQPRCAEAIHFLGLAAMTRGKLEEALALVRKSIELEEQAGSAGPPPFADAAPARLAEYHNNHATVLGRMNRAIEALGAAQSALDLKPDFPEAHSNKGVAYEKLGRLDDAIEAYRCAVGGREDYAEGLSNLGNALSRKGEHDEAAARLRRAAELRPRDAGLRKSLGNALRRAGKPEQAVTAYRMAVDLNPRDADAHNNLGAALQESGKVKEAESVLRTCLSINPNHTDAHWNLGLALLALGNWREGWMEYEWRSHLRENLGHKRGFPQPGWNGSPLEGRTLLVMCEQGLGDTIQFIRYVPLLAARGAKVIIECQAKLRPLLLGLKTTTGGGCATQTTAGGGCATWQVIARGEPLPNFDMHARLMTLPGIFRSTPDDLPNDVPYLHVDAERVERMRRELAGESRGGDGEKGRGGEDDEKRRRQSDDRLTFSPLPLSHSPPHPLSAFPSPTRPLSASFRVGLVWQGSTAHKGDRFRSIPLETFKPLAQVPGVRMVSLQNGHGSEQLAAMGGEIDILQWSDSDDTTAAALLDTAAMMKCLDLVIAVDTSLAHLAGAMGTAVWVAMPLANDWRWLTGRDDSPWYPTMRLFRQTTLGCWDDVIERMAGALRARVAEGQDCGLSNSELMPEWSFAHEAANNKPADECDTPELAII